MLILWCGDDSSGVQGWHQSIGHKIAKMRRLATSKHREMMDFINYPSSQLFHWNSTSIAVIWNLALFKSNHCGEQSEKARLSLYLIIAGTVIAPSLHLSLSVEPQNNLSQLHRHWWKSRRRIFGGETIFFSEDTLLFSLKTNESSSPVYLREQWKTVLLCPRAKQEPCKSRPSVIYGGSAFCLQLLSDFALSVLWALLWYCTSGQCKRAPAPVLYVSPAV